LKLYHLATLPVRKVFGVALNIRRDAFEPPVVENGLSVDIRLLHLFHLRPGTKTTNLHFCMHSIA
jgi:hypothetical protein